MKIIISRVFSIADRDLSSEKFFQETIEKCSEEKLLNVKKIEKILYRRMELLKEKLKYYTRNESSSVMKEEAESIQFGIDYTLGLYLKSLSDESIIKELKEKDLGMILKLGEDLIKEKVKKNEVLLNQIIKNKLNVNNYAYDDTIEYGLSVFFKKYDVFFKPQDTPCSIDYQLPIDIMCYSGIEYMEKYEGIINFENEFCNKFDVSNLKRMLKNYDRRYEELLINIFRIALINVVGNVICDKDLKELTLNNNDMLQIKYELKGLSKEEIMKKFKDAYKKSLVDLKVNNEKLFDYGVSIIEKDEDYICRNVLEGTLKSIFVTFSEVSNREVIKFVDSQKLKDSQFRKYTEEIRSCEVIEDKINIINNKFRSLEDIVDMLESECLFKDEYKTYFKRINEINLVLLYKMYKEKYSDDYNKEWCEYLKQYISDLSDENRMQLEENVGKIEF